MKLRLLVAALLAAPALFAQTTHVINWGTDVYPTEFILTIPPDDIITWVWVDEMPHSVTSLEGTSTETFDSGLITGLGQSYTHTFTEIGENPYNCVEHFWMSGNIYVEEETSSATQQALKTEFTVFPNPAADVLTVSSPDPILKIEMYDISGKLVLQAPAGTASVKLYLQGFQKGQYVVKAFTDKGNDSTIVVKD